MLTGSSATAVETNDIIEMHQATLPAELSNDLANFIGFLMLPHQQPAEPSV